MPAAFSSNASARRSRCLPPVASVSPSFSPAMRAAMSAAAVTVWARSSPSCACRCGGLLLERSAELVLGRTGGLLRCRSDGGEAHEQGHADGREAPEGDEQGGGGHGGDGTDGV